MSDRRSFPAALAVPALLGLAGMAATAFHFGAARFFANWIVWFLFLLTIGLGCLFIVALEHTVRSHWSVPIRRIPERMSGLAVWVAPLALVALFSLPVLYPWTQPEAAHDAMVAGKLGWLNIPFFSARTAVSLVLWGFCYALLCLGSMKQDASKDPAFTVKARKWAPLVLVIFGFTLTNAAFDWISSLEPLWYSDIFGVYVFAGTFLAGIAGTALGVAYLVKRGRLPGVTFDHVYNLGGFLFAFIVFWSYIAFAQYMLQWYANMPEEVFWYQKRIEGFWLVFVWVMAALHFVIPFLFLVSRRVKGSIRLLAPMAGLILAAHFLDLFWMVFPVLGEGVLPSWPEISFALFFVPAGLLWARRAMERGEDMPVGDPLLEKALAFKL